ncbi:MAG TPA: anti-sigma F factor [Firmicutes bacterium]|jgi:stage II sporulation protein AB (anti-sigma F factor)|nr:anti-sigma F factor [Bacillota bacterium]
MDYMHLEIPARSENERFVRVVVAAFAARLDPTLEELNELKTAVSEAVTNCILHAYDDADSVIIVKVMAENNNLIVEVADRGKGIEDIAKAKEPLYTDKPELERSGMGFTIMENFMDALKVQSRKGEGTVITMSKNIGKIAGHDH